jgi:large subunit ribosomal protein L23
MDIYQVIKKPLITEKANLLKESGNQICLQVDRRANKVEIRRAVETLFKSRRMGKTMGRRSDWKKAIVRLAPGKRIEFFEGA